MSNQNKSKSLLLQEIDQLRERLANESLQNSERHSSAWIEHSPVCTKIVDLDFNLQYMSSSGVKDLRIENINDYYGKPYPLPFYPDSFKISMLNNLVKVKETGEVVTQENLLTDAMENELWYQSTLVPIFDKKNQLDYIMVVSMNTTEKKQSETALKSTLENMELQIKQRTEELYKSEERFSLAVRGANEGIWDWNFETNEVFYSIVWKNMLGYEDAELENKLTTWELLVHPDDKNRVFDKVHAYATGQSDSFEAEMRMYHKDGHEMIILSRASMVIRDSDAKPVRLVGTHVDITERKKAETLNEKNAQILEMIAMGQPAAKIYDVIALMYEARHPGLRCSLLELHKNKLMHGGAPSLPKEYRDAIHGLENGPEVGSCGTSTYFGKRVLVEDIATDKKWQDIKHVALPHGLGCCWSEPIKNSSGKVLGAFGMYYNHPALPNEEESDDLKSAARLASIVMERDQAQKRIRHLAYKDELTGLSSRAHFYQSLGELIKESKRHKKRFSLLFIDLDNFKDINDSLGHDTGDLLLKEIARRLGNITCSIDIIARLGGDEFCIIIKDIIDEFSSANIAQRCLEAISQPIMLASRKHTPTCSIGIAYFPNDGNNISTLLKAADTSLYAAKEEGKNCYSFYNPELTRKTEYRFLVEQYLRDAIEKKQLSLVYQPQIRINTGEVIGVEVLSRWNHPKLGLVPPTEFIPIAERIGMMKPLTEWVLKTACSQAVSWKNSGLPALRVAVNISPNHFLDKKLVTLVKSVIDETGMIPSELELEVTESVVQTNQENLSIFKNLKELGILLAIDDFGTGYSSFASLNHLKVDCLKIDKYFIDKILNDKKTSLLVNSMIDIGHNLEYGIIAEGVETQEQFNLLKKYGCETVQGYLFSKPISADSIPKFINSLMALH